MKPPTNFAVHSRSMPETQIIIEGSSLRWWRRLQKDRVCSVQDIVGVVLGPSNGCNVLYDRNYQVLAKFAGSMEYADLPLETLCPNWICRNGMVPFIDWTGSFPCSHLFYCDHSRTVGVNYCWAGHNGDRYCLFTDWDGMPGGSRRGADACGLPMGGKPLRSPLGMCVLSPEAWAGLYCTIESSKRWQRSIPIWSLMR